MLRSGMAWVSLVLVSLLLVSCPSPFDVSLTGQVVVDFGSNSSRAIRALPENVATIDIKVSGSGMNDMAVTLISPNFSTTLDVPAGPARTFAVLVSDPEAKLRYRGSTILDVEAGVAHDLSVTMSSLYYVSYDTNGGDSGVVGTEASVPVDETPYLEGDSVVIARNTGNLIRSGYEFWGWNTAADGSGTVHKGDDVITMPASDLKLFAFWHEVITYTVKFDSTGGSEITAVEVVEDTRITPPIPGPSRPHYAFQGWFKEAALTTPWDFLVDKVTSDITLYAKWQATKDILSFSITNPLSSAGVISGTDIAVTLPAGTAPALLTNMTPSIFFNGALCSPGPSTPRDFTNPVQYTITAEDGTTKVYTVTVTVLASIAKDITAFSFASPVATGVITGTNIAVAVPAATNVTNLVPTIVHNGASISPLSGVAKDFTLPVNYTVTAGDSTTKVYTVTVTKKFSVTINYGSGGTGTPIGMLEYLPGAVVNLDVTPDAGYSFSGWTGDISNIVAPTSMSTTLNVLSASTTINGIFAPNNYNVTFDANGGGGVMTPQSILFNSSQSLTFNTFSYPGYMFVGWATSPTGPVVYADGVSFTMNVLGQTLYAQWTAMVTYDSNTADVNASPPNQIVYSYSPIVGALPAPPTKAGYDFAGWSTALNDGLEFTATTLVTGSMTVYAMWSTTGLGYTLINGNTEYSVGKGSAVTSGVVSIPYYWMGKKVTAIDSSAFSNCTTMTGIVIPNGVTIIGDQAFYHCDMLASVTIPPNVTTLYAASFQYCLALTSVVIPAGVTTIGNQVFAYDSNLTSVTIPNTVTSMGDWVFGYCTSLTSLLLPSNLTTIGASTFRGMSGLLNLTIPATVTSIGTGAFSECTVLNLLTVNPITPPSAGTDLFLSSPAIVANSIRVPAGSVATYQAAVGWITYSAFIGSQ